MKRVVRAAALAGVVACAVGAMSSCTVAAAGAAVSAAQSGVAIIKKGRVTTVVLARYADVNDAVLKARDVLALETRRVIEKEDHVVYFFEEPEGGKMSVYVTYRTDTVTSLEVDVGALGRSDVARLMYAQVMDNLGDADAFLQDWQEGAPAAAP